MGKRKELTEETKKLTTSKKSKKEKRKEEEEEEVPSPPPTLDAASDASSDEEDDDDDDVREAMTFFEQLHGDDSAGEASAPKEDSEASEDSNDSDDSDDSDSEASDSEASDSEASDDKEEAKAPPPPPPALKVPTAKRASKPTPPGYVCNACKKGGHWIFDCSVFLAKKNQCKLADASGGKKEEDGPSTPTSKQQQQQQPKTKVFVQGLPFSMTQKGLRELFEEADCGPVHAVNLIKFEDSDRCKGMAYVMFKSPEAAAKALLQSGRKLGDSDRWLTVAYEKPPKTTANGKGPRNKQAAAGGGGGGGGGGRCFRCGKTGHAPKDCTEKRVCYRCRSTEHLSNSCPLRKQWPKQCQPVSAQAAQ